MAGGALNAINDSWELLASDLRNAAEAELAAGESPLAWLELDLDTRLHFSRGLVVLTPRRLLAVEPEESTDVAELPPKDGLRVCSWPLDRAAGLRA